MQLEIKTVLCSGAIALLSIGCGAAVPPPEMAAARRELRIAQGGEAGRRTPAELLVAERTLQEAEVAWRDRPGTTEGRDLAYISDRQTLVAEAHARQQMIAESAQRQQAAYQHDLETSNHNARTQQESDRVTIAAGDQQVAAQNQTIAQQQGQLANAEAARVAAEARASEAMARLSALVVVRETATQTTITILGALLFRSGGSDLLPGATDRLAAVADALNTQPTRTVVVQGFTDSRGTPSGNEVLSQARAESVRSFLLSHGVDASRVRAVGIGQAQPVADNGTAEGRANNRRVEIVLGPTPPAVHATISIR